FPIACARRWRESSQADRRQAAVSAVHRRPRNRTPCGTLALEGGGANQSVVHEKEFQYFGHGGLCMRRSMCGLIGLALAGGLMAGPANAAEEGLITLHELVRVGNKICTRDHFHSGSSYGQPSRQ